MITTLRIEVMTQKGTMTKLLTNHGLGFRETIASPSVRFFNFASLMDRYGSSFGKQHIQYQGDLSFCNFQYA